MNSSWVSDNSSFFKECHGGKRCFVHSDGTNYFLFFLCCSWVKPLYSFRDIACRLDHPASRLLLSFLFFVCLFVGLFVFPISIVEVKYTVFRLPYTSKGRYMTHIWAMGYKWMSPVISSGESFLSQSKVEMQLRSPFWLSICIALKWDMIIETIRSSCGSEATKSSDGTKNHKELQT